MSIEYIKMNSCDPPAHVRNDIQALDDTIAVESLEIKNSPDNAWTIRITDETSEEEFDSIVSLVEETVSTDNINAFYELELKANWLIQVQYTDN